MRQRSELADTGRCLRHDISSAIFIAPYLHTVGARLTVSLPRRWQTAGVTIAGLVPTLELRLVMISPSCFSATR
jgi:hypothetical protein